MVLGAIIEHSKLTNTPRARASKRRRKAIVSAVQVDTIGESRTEKDEGGHWNATAQVADPTGWIRKCRGGCTLLFEGNVHTGLNRIVIT